MKLKVLLVLLIFVALYFLQSSHTAGTDKMPGNFVNIQKVIPDVVLDIRYYSPHNFVGE